MTRTTGSVPEGRSSTRPRPARSASARAIASRTARRLRVEAAGELHVHQHLREQHELAREFAERLAAARHGGEHLQRRDDGVARGMAVEAQQVPGILAAAFPAALEQAFEHVAVAHLGARERDAHLGEPALEREIGHERADHAAAQPSGAVRDP